LPGGADKEFTLAYSIDTSMFSFDKGEVIKVYSLTILEIHLVYERDKNVANS